MSMTVELGRAVLCSPCTRNELWFTILITLSPQHLPIDLHELNSNDIIDYLLSGDVWAARGNGFHLNLELTRRGEPLGHQQLQQLAENIVKGPIWRQLNLQPSLPINAWHDSGMIRINISHSHNEFGSEGRKRHPVFSSAPPADIKPPMGVPTLTIQSVQCTMDIIDVQPRARTMRHKKAKPPATESAQTHARPDILQTCDPKSDSDFDILLHEEFAITDAIGAENDPTLALEPILHVNKRQRKCQSTPPLLRTSSLPLPVTFQAFKKRKLSSTFSDGQVTESRSLVSSDITSFEMMIDSALRFSIFNSLGKSVNGIKIKANTFRGGLAEVAPALWCPGYLSALSQRTHLLPVIDFALSRLANTKARSTSLQTKIAKLANLPIEPANGSPHRDDINKPEIKRTISIAAPLWTHTQKNLLAINTPGPLLRFLTSDSQISSPSDSDMLEEYSTSLKRDEYDLILDEFQRVHGKRNNGVFHQGPPMHPSGANKV